VVNCQDEVALAQAEVVNAQTEVTNAAAQVTLAEAEADAAAASAALIAGWGYENVWSSGTDYDANNIAYHDGYSYISLQTPNQNQTPAFNAGAGTAYWGVMASKGDTGSPGAGTGDMLGENNLTDLDSVSTAFANIKQAATTTATGVLEIATDAEAQAKSDTGRALVPSNLAALGASATFAGLVELATSAEVATGTDTARAVTPAGLAALTASTTVDGLIEIATDAEAQSKSATDKALVPSNLAALGASVTFAGLVELATSAETITGTDTARAVTPAGLAALTASETVDGLVELATTAEVVTGTDTARAVTPAGVQAGLNGGAVTRTAAVNMADQLLDRAYIGDYALETTAKGNLGATPTFDYAAGNVQTGTLSADITTFTVSNWPATGRYGKLSVILTQDASTARTVDWSNEVDAWSDGAEPDLSTLSSRHHIILETLDGGTTVYGYRAGGNFA
jgi:hypothetical protein